MSYIFYSLFMILLGIVALCFSSYSSGSGSPWGSVRVSALGVLGVTFFIVGLPLLGMGVRILPELPFGVKMYVVARYVSFDDKIKVVVQWQEDQERAQGGEVKADIEKAVNLEDLKVEDYSVPAVGDTILKVDDGTTIVLPKSQTAIDIP